MTPRPRKVSDEDIFAAAYRAMSRLSPNELTLAEIAAEAGVTASALVQRFGSKRALLLALTAGAADFAPQFIRQLRVRHGSPLAALHGYGDCVAQLAKSPAALARNLAYLQIDLTDDDLRAHLLAQARATHAALKELIDEAVAIGELLPATDSRTLARTVEAILSGSMLQWAIYRKGTAVRWMRQDLDAVLAPYVAAGVPTGRTRSVR